MTISVEDLALDLAVHPGDVVVIVESLVDLHDDDIPDVIAAEVKSVLDPHGERTAPAGFYWPGHPAEIPDPDEPRGVMGMSPTRGEGFYPDL